MSWEYTYYSAYRNKKENKIYFLGPYNHEGKIKDVFSRSSSFASDMYELFRVVNKEEISDKMLNDLYNLWDVNDEEFEGCFRQGLLGYCALENLPTGDYIKSGYFLNSKIKEFEETHDCDDLCGYLTTNEYLRMLQNEIKFGKPGKKMNDWGEEYIPNSCEDYSFYRYVDYSCEEYEAHELRKMANILTNDGYDFYLKSKDKEHYYDIDPNIELGAFLIQG